MNLFEAICRNSFYLESRVTKEEKIRTYKEDGKCFDKKYWAFRDSLCPSLMCPISIIENNTGEEYDFTKHIKPLIDDGLIFIRDFVNCFPHSERLREESLKRHGLCQDDKNIVYLQFFLGKIDPNKGKTFEDAWI